MIKGEHGGFTIIEVTLFLGISAMLLLVAFSFTASTLRNTRFSDATKSIQNFLQEQYTRVQTNSLSLNAPSGKVATCSGTNAVVTADGTSSTGTSSTCILLGSALDIASDGMSIAIYPVLGFANATNQTLSGVNPQIWAAAKETYVLAWQSKISTRTAVLARNVADDSVDRTATVSRLLFLREVQSESINFYATSNSGASIASVVTDGIGARSNTRNVPTLICIQSDEGGALRGAIQIKGTGLETNTNTSAIASSVVGQDEKFFEGFVNEFEGVTCSAS